ncbi:retrovirus-related pol polyprotein from transposon TNT 1-94, partial [Tanacetum coccineum]
MEQMLLAKQDEAGGILTNESAADQNYDDEPCYESAFVNEVQSSSINENDEQIYYSRSQKTTYELLRGRKPNVEYFHVFGSLCYPTNNHDDLGKMKPKADIGVFIGYSETSRGFRIYNCRTKRIMETIHVKFDELTARG